MLQVFQMDRQRDAEVMGPGLYAIVKGSMTLTITPNTCCELYRYDVPGLGQSTGETISTHRGPTML